MPVRRMPWLGSRQGERLALVTDAGLPGISDPGARVAAAVAAAGLPVVPVPGANAALTALVGSGLAAERFLFCGFLPSKAGARRTELERLQAMAAAGGEPLVLVFYEAPHRIVEMLEDVGGVWGGECRVVLARELTKLHEEFLRGSVCGCAGATGGAGAGAGRDGGAGGSATFGFGRQGRGIDFHAGGAAYPGRGAEREGRAEARGPGARDGEERGLSGVDSAPGQTRDLPSRRKRRWRVRWRLLLRSITSGLSARRQASYSVVVGTCCRRRCFAAF